MSVFLDLHGRISALDLSSSSSSPGDTGPVLGPFVGIRMYRDEVRVATTLREFSLQRIGDWIYYDGALYADVEFLAEDQIGPCRARRLCTFDPALADLALEEFS